MYAIVEIAGQQFKVEEGKKIFVHRLENGSDESVKFDRVLLVDNDGAVTVGTPTIGDALVEGKVVDHVRGEKVIVFKKKRKKGYRVKNGHRQNFTQVEILSINVNGSKKKSKNAASAEPAAEKKAHSKKASAHKEEAGETAINE
jgi:large subunit ribosomal protein L21